MPSDNASKEDTPPVDEQSVVSADLGKAPAERTLTEVDVREIESSGITLADVIREIEAQIACATE